MNAKVRLLQTNDDWRERYEDLVKSGLLSDTLFWSDKKEAVDACQAHLNMLQECAKEHDTPAHERAALVLRKIRGVTDGRGEVKFRLTSDTIASIYSNLPKVKQLHDEFVTGTNMLNEKEFWTQFCTSKTFGKELGVGEEFSGKEGNIFDRAFEHQPEQVASTSKDSDDGDDLALPSSIPNPLLNVAMNEEHDLLDRGRGDKRPALKAIKRLNKHSFHTLEAIAPINWTMEQLIDLPDLHSIPVHVEAADSTLAPRVLGTPPAHIDYSSRYDPELFANTELFTFDGYKEQVMLEKAPSAPFKAIAESDFTRDRFGQARRVYKNVMHCLRLFWRQPAAPGHRTNCQLCLDAVDKLLSDFGALDWPGPERANADSLLHCAYTCIDTARAKMAKS